MPIYDSRYRHSVEFNSTVLLIDVEIFDSRNEEQLLGVPESN